MEDENVVTWNYRVVEGDGYVAIHEVYYRDGEIVSWSEEPDTMMASDINELKEILSLMLNATKQPVLSLKKTGGKI